MIGAIDTIDNNINNQIKRRFFGTQTLMFVGNHQIKLTFIGAVPMGFSAS